MPPPPYIRACLAASIVLLAGRLLADDFHPPGGVNYAHTSGNVTFLPGGRALKPMGSQVEVGPGAFGLAVSPKGLIGVSETGFERFGVAVLEPHKEAWQEKLFWAQPTDDDKPAKTPIQAARWQSASYGIAFDAD